MACHLDGIFSADSLWKLSALLPWNVDGHILTLLVWHIFALGPRHLAFNLLGHLLADLFWNALALLVVAVPVALLLVLGRALLLVLPVRHCLVHHLALLLVNCVAPAKTG